MKRLILAINPGSTSTKIAVYEEETKLFSKGISHSIDELSKFPTIADQYNYRKEAILNELKANNIDVNDIKIVIGRGGLTRPVRSGVYRVNELMKQHLREGYAGTHACNLGGLIADNIAKSIGLEEAYIADPGVVDELADVARIAGHPLFERKTVFHALNQKAVSRIYAKKIGRKYEDLNLIVAHMGGGISIGAHCHGEVIDVNEALTGEGPFSPERSGTLPMNQLIEVCFSGQYTKDEVLKMIAGKGGYVAYFGTNEARAIEIMAREGDPKAELLEEAMAYQVSKYIGECAAVLRGKVDAIILTGGIAHGKIMIDRISKYVSWIAPIEVHPGEDEMGALAMNALMVLDGQTEIKNYGDPSCTR
ncbi:MAG: butyrate kinase [Bacteroidales bacterium]|nr:butyrate kinase [Bacteroidales bacterium]